MKLKINKYINFRLYYFFVLFYFFLVFLSFALIFSNAYNSAFPIGLSINDSKVVITKKLDNYNMGEAILYYKQVEGRETIAIKEITEIGGNVYVVENDTKKISDRELVRPRLIIGKKIMVLPCLGYLASFLKSFFGLLIFVFIPAVVIIGIEFFRIIKTVKK